MPLTADEQREVRELIAPAEAAAFFDQPPVDQRHGLDSARTALFLGADRAQVRSALLHDIGKRHAGLGILGRSIASVLIKLRLPMTRRMRLYRDHGEIGGSELERLLGDCLESRFARHHHRHRPPAIEEAVWNLLQRADHERTI